MTLSRFAALQWLSFAAVAVVLMYLLSPILTPFVAAGILAYICNPLVQRLCAGKIPRTLAVLLVLSGLFLLFALLLMIMLPLLEKEISRFATRLPDWIEAARIHLLPLLQRWFGTDLEWDSAALKNALLSHGQSAGGIVEKPLPWLSSSGGAIIGVVVDLLLTPVAMFYLLRDWNIWLARLDDLIPRHLHTKAAEIVSEVDRILAQFLRGQISVMLLMSGYHVLVLWLATLAAVMQFTEFGNVVLVWAVFGTGQLLEGMVITPWLVGGRVGLHPLVVIFSLLAFGQLFGFFGLLLALPLAAISLVGMRYGKGWYLSSTMYIKP